MQQDQPGSQALALAPQADRLADGQADGQPAASPGARLLFIGDGDTEGRGVEAPYPDLVQKTLGLPCVNLGQVDGGLETYWCDWDLIGRARAARLVVLQLPGLLGQCNRFYTVHPRRNDRFIRANAPLRDLFPEADFTRIAFVGHLMRMLERIGPRRVDQIYHDLQRRWLARLRLTRQLLGPRCLFLWIESSQDPAARWVTPELLRHAAEGATLVQVGAASLHGHAPLSRQMGRVPTRAGLSQGDHFQVAEALMQALPDLLQDTGQGR